MELNTVWFVLIAVLLAGYAVLDGFDLGVGILHLFHQTDEDRRVALNAIGPVWDGNEVWLVVAGGALFAAFPEAYATVFSGFYLAFMALLLALVLRAVSIEARGKRPGSAWRHAWDATFCAGSLLATLLLGVALGNLLDGVPLDERHNLIIRFLDLLSPYPLLVGVAIVAFFAQHGAAYLALKSEGAMQATARNRLTWASSAAALCFSALIAFTLVSQPHLWGLFQRQGWLLVVPVAAALALAAIPLASRRGQDLRAFLASGSFLALLMALAAISLYPNLVPSDPFPERSLTIDNAASSGKTLGIMLVIAGFGLPLMIAYAAVVYWFFRGKVRIDGTSY
jgi:cytochrome d ubiquinol oxidase subunit II